MVPPPCSLSELTVPRPVLNGDSPPLAEPDPYRLDHMRVYDDAKRLAPHSVTRRAAAYPRARIARSPPECEPALTHRPGRSISRRADPAPRAPGCWEAPAPAPDSLPLPPWRA